MFVVDPCNDNILNIHVYLDGVLIHTLCLSRNYYYQELILNYSHLHWLVWNKVPMMRELIARLCDNHFKTSNMDRLHESTLYYARIWENICIIKL